MGPKFGHSIGTCRFLCVNVVYFVVAPPDLYFLVACAMVVVGGGGEGRGGAEGVPLRNIHSG